MDKLLQHTLAVVVLYEMPWQNSQSLQALLPWCEKGLRVLVYDNSKELQERVSKHFTYHHAGENRGVSAAYNWAAQWAAAEKLNFLLLLDQDTHLSEAYFQKAALEQDVEKPTVYVPRITSNGRLLSPFAYRAGRSWRLEELPGLYLNWKEYRAINSAMLIRLVDFQKLGGFDENLPLDFSDIEFGDRLAELNLGMEVLNVAVEHGFSGDEKPDREKAQKRFSRFLEAAQYYARKSSFHKGVKRTALRHSLAMSLKYRSGYFLKRFLQTPFGR